MFQFHTNTRSEYELKRQHSVVTIAINWIINFFFIIVFFPFNLCIYELWRGSVHQYNNDKQNKQVLRYLDTKFQTIYRSNTIFFRLFSIFTISLIHFQYSFSCRYSFPLFFVLATCINQNISFSLSFVSIRHRRRHKQPISKDHIIKQHS